MHALIASSFHQLSFFLSLFVYIYTTSTYHEFKVLNLRRRKKKKVQLEEMTNIKVMSLTILLVSVILASSSIHEAFAQAGYGGIDPFEAALVHCNAGPIEKQNCCEALSAAVHNEEFCWSSLFGQIFVTDLINCPVIPKC